MRSPARRRFSARHLLTQRLPTRAIEACGQLLIAHENPALEQGRLTLAE
jgi:hypothetical protein